MHKTTYHYEHIGADSIEELVAIANEWTVHGFRLVHVAPRGLVAPCRLANSQAAFEPTSLVATGLDSIQAAMSLSFHLTAAEPTFTGRGKSPCRISR